MVKTDKTVFPEWAWKKQYWLWGSHDGINWSFIDAKKMAGVLDGDTSYKYVMLTFWPIYVDNRETGKQESKQSLEKAKYLEE